MTKSFRDKRTAAIFAGLVTKGTLADLAKCARNKLLIVHRARSLVDLRVPPASHLEALSGDRAGQHSVRVNEQWRICFRWSDGDAEDVEFCDYHGKKRR